MPTLIPAATYGVGGLPPRGTVGGGWAAGNRLRFAIRGIDVVGGRYGEFGAGAGLFWECGGWFYGTMPGPGWYHTATSVPRVRNLPFSALRLLIQLTRKPPYVGPAARFTNPWQKRSMPQVCTKDRTGLQG